MLDLELVAQVPRIVVIDEHDRLADAEGVVRPEDRRVPVGPAHGPHVELVVGHPNLLPGAMIYTTSVVYKLSAWIMGSSAASAAAVAAVFVWLGMVIAISFIEAPLKFRATGVTLPIGLSIGRLVFRALNSAEAVFATVLLVSVASATSCRPRECSPPWQSRSRFCFSNSRSSGRALTRRSDRVLAGEDAPRSAGHHAYVGLELVKVIALLATGIFLLAR